MKYKSLIALALVFAIHSSAQTQEFPIGIWFVGIQNGLNQVDSMGFTWMQVYGGWDLSNTANFNHVLQNNRNLKVLATLERNILLPSFAQRMEYEAWREDSNGGIFNYFASHATGSPNGTIWQALTSSHSAGFMVQSPVPDSLYFYERDDWVATATMRIDPTADSTDQVVRIEIAEIAQDTTILAQRIITEGEFGGSTAFQSFEVSYTLPPPAPPPPVFKLPVIASVAQAQQTQRHMEHPD